MKNIGVIFILFFIFTQSTAQKTTSYLGEEYTKVDTRWQSNTERWRNIFKVSIDVFGAGGEYLYGKEKYKSNNIGHLKYRSFTYVGFKVRPYTWANMNDASNFPKTYFSVFAGYERRVVTYFPRIEYNFIFGTKSALSGFIIYVAGIRYKRLSAIIGGGQTSTNVMAFNITYQLNKF